MFNLTYIFQCYYRLLQMLSIEGRKNKNGISVLYVSKIDRDNHLFILEREKNNYHCHISIYKEGLKN